MTTRTDRRRGGVAALALLSLGLAVSAPGQQMDQEQVLRLANQIRKRILTLDNYGVFDAIRFEIKPAESGYVVVLKGYASRPTLKTSAERVASRIELVKSVENEIVVLPNSRMDEDLRFRVYASVYGHPTLSRYNPNRGVPLYGSARSFGRALSLGISNDPPIGYHPIAIIVNSGNVTLEGVVDNDGDKTIAGIQANQVAGVFSVTNNLETLTPSKPK